MKRRLVAPAPNRLWVADITCVKVGTRFAYVAFVTDVFSRAIVGWSVSSSLDTGVALAALRQAIQARDIEDELIHHSDRGTQYVSYRYTRNLEAAGVQPSVGSVGDSYDNALAESVNALYKAECAKPKRAWQGLQELELETLDWVHWFNTKRLMERLGWMAPTEYEEQFYARQAAQSCAA